MELPPLRSCPEDVCFLIDRLMEKIPQKYGVPPREPVRGARSKLLAYNWPGNIRELENVLENAVALSESELIYAERIHLEGTAPAPLTLKERLKREERQILRQTLAQCGGRRCEGHELLGLSQDRVLWQAEGIPTGLNIVLFLERSSETELPSCLFHPGSGMCWILASCFVDSV